jgi:hypothetical protein
MGVSGAARAQAGSHLGPQIGYNFDYEALVLGAQYSAPLGPHLELYPSFNYFFVDVGSAWAVNLDLKYRLPVQNANWLYVGGGLNVTRNKAGSYSHTDARANLIAGAETLTGTFHPFGEIRLTAGHGSTVQLVGGVNFSLRNQR